VASAAGIEAKFRRAAAWVTWKHLAMVGAGCVLEGATADELSQKGGKIKFNQCGPDKRKCAKIKVGIGTFGKAGESYMILDGY
jgi:hypothetical protein